MTKLRTRIIKHLLEELPSEIDKLNSEDKKELYEKTLNILSNYLYEIVKNYKFVDLSPKKFQEIIYRRRLRIVEEKIEEDLSKEDLESLVKLKARNDLLHIAANYHPNQNKFLTECFKYLLRGTIKNIRFFQRVNEELIEIKNVEDISDKFKEVFKSGSVLGSSLHLSTADTLLIRVVYDKFRLLTPHIRAGSNLYVDESKIILPLMNAYQVDRDRISKKSEEFDPLYRLLFSMYEKYCTKIASETRCTHPFVYIWDGRTRTGDGTSKTRYLRDVERFKPNMFKNFVELNLENPNLNIHVFLISQHYTIISESGDIINGNLATSKESKSFTKDVLQRSNTYPIYVVLNEPKKLLDYVTSKNPKNATIDVANGMLNELRNNIVIGPETLFSAVLYKLYHYLNYNGENTPPYEYIRKEFIEQAKHMEKNLINYNLGYDLNNSADFKSFYNQMLQFCIETNRINKDRRMNLPLIEFYYNQVKHLMRK